MASSAEQINGVDIFRLARGNTKAGLAAKIETLICQIDPDIVHSHWISIFPVLEIASAIKGLEAKLVHNLREYSFLCGFGTLFRRGVGACQSLCEDCGSDRKRLKQYSQQVDAVIGVSQFCLDVHLRAGLFENAVSKSVVHNSYAPPANELPEKSPGLSDKTRLGFLGRFSSEKGGLWLMHRLETTGLWKKVTLTIASQVDQGVRSKIESRFPNLEIQWLGFTEPSNLFNKIDWLVVPSICYEAFGRIVIEAYGHGVPVLASNLGTLPDLVKHEVTGRVDDPFSKGDFEQQLNWILDHGEQWPGYASNAWQHRKYFLPEELTRKTIDLYRQLL